MDNKISEGKTIKIVAQADISAGDYVSLGANFGGIALDDAKTGAVCVLDVSGVYEIPKATLTSTYTLGAPVSITSGKASVVTVTSSTTTVQIASIAGNVVETANSAATTVKIKLR